MLNDVREEWRIRDVETKAERAVSRLYELDSLRSDVASLERSDGEIRSEIVRLCDLLETCLRQISFLESEVVRLSQTGNE